MTRCDEDSLRHWAERAVAMACDRGADKVKVDVAQKEDFALEIRNGEVDNLSRANSRNLSLTVAVGQRRASVTTCVLNETAVRELIDTALALCPHTDEDPFFSLPDPEWMAGDPIDLDICDPGLRSLDVETRIERTRMIEALLLDRAPELSSDGAKMHVTDTSFALANSNGFSFSRTSTLVSQGLAAFSLDRGGSSDLNTGRRQMGSFTSRARHLADLDHPEAIVDRTIERVRRKLGARKPRTGDFPVYFEPAMARVLWSSLVSAVSGTAVYRGQSYLADRLGRAVAAPEINIEDNPLIPRGLGSRWYDAEGVAKKPIAIVRDGTLESFTMGTYAARKLGAASTGHSGGIGNLVVRPGAHSESALLRKMGTGVWLTTVLGQGVNINTGDYSRGAQGLWVENGEPVYPIMEFTLAGNLDAMFKNIVALGNNVEEKYPVRTPGLLIGEMSLSGN